MKKLYEVQYSFLVDPSDDPIFDIDFDVYLINLNEQELNRLVRQLESDSLIMDWVINEVKENKVVRVR